MKSDASMARQKVRQRNISQGRPQNFDYNKFAGRGKRSQKDGQSMEKVVKELFEKITESQNLLTEMTATIIWIKRLLISLIGL